MKKIEYEDKVDVNLVTNRKNQATAEDFNEIKTVVNEVVEKIDAGINEVENSYNDYEDHLTVTGVIGSRVMQGLTYFKNFWYWGQNLGAGTNGRIHKINPTTGVVDSYFAGPPHSATGDVREDHDTMIWGSGGDDVPSAWEMDGNGTVIRKWTFTGTTYNRGGAVVYTGENTILLYTSSRWSFDIREVTINDNGTWSYGAVVATGTRSMGRPQGFDYKDGYIYYLCDDYNAATNSADETVKVLYKMSMPNSTGPVIVNKVWRYHTGTTNDEAEGLTFINEDLYFGAHDSKKIRRIYYPTTSKSVSTYYKALTGISPVHDVTTTVNTKITLIGNTTITLTNLVDGMSGNIIITQDATGGRTLNISPTPDVINGGTGLIPLTGTASSKDIIYWTYDGANLNVNFGSNYN